MSIPITDAKDIPLDQITGSLPNVSNALLDWLQPLTFIMIVKSVVNFKLLESKTVYSFMGVVESITPTKLEMKPEGQRSWNYINIWTLPNVTLKIDDIFSYMGKEYRVERRNDWVQYGYSEFEAVENYSGG